MVVNHGMSTLIPQFVPSFPPLPVSTGPLYVCLSIPALEIGSSVANQNCNEVSLYTGQNGHHQNIYK